MCDVWGFEKEIAFQRKKAFDPKLKTDLIYEAVATQSHK